MLTDEQLNTPITVQFIRQHGYCARGTKTYWGLLGLDFKKLLRNEMTVRDLVPYQSDAFIGALIDEVLRLKRKF